MRVAFAELAHDLAVGEEEHAMRDGRGACVVGHHDDRLAVFVDRAAQELEDLPARRRVEVSGGLVREENRRLRDERAGDGDTLLLPARQLRRPVREPVGEPDVADQLVEPAVLRLLAGDGERRRMFSFAFSIGRRLKNWNTKPMCSRRSFVRSLSPSVVISVPATSTSPVVGLSSPARMCISVDFPEPEGPITAVALPGAMFTETPRSASTAVSPSP